MPALSVVIIAKNEALAIADCILSVAKIADEIVVLDSGSTDGTQAICGRLGARVIETDWPGFGEQKRRAVQAARNDWVLSLDADERVSDQLRENIRRTMESPRFLAYRFARKNRFLGRYLTHGEGYPDWSLRLFDRKNAQWSSDAVHEKVVVQAPVGQLDGDLLHHSAESLAQYLDKQNRYTSLSADIGAARKISLVRLIGSPLVRFIKFYFLRGGFLDGIPGFIHIAIGCFNSLSKYAKVYERRIRGTSDQ